MARCPEEWGRPRLRCSAAACALTVRLERCPLLARGVCRATPSEGSGLCGGRRPRLLPFCRTHARLWFAALPPAACMLCAHASDTFVGASFRRDKLSAQYIICCRPCTVNALRVRCDGFVRARTICRTHRRGPAMPVV